MLLIALLLTLVSFLGINLLWKCSYWHRNGVSGPRGLPFFGNMREYFLGRKHFGYVYEDIYDAHPHLPYIGIYRWFNEPALLMRSQDLIKEVMIRSFQHFQDNVLFINRKRDPIVAYNPFVAKGDLWKSMRAEIIPIFTPNKVKASFPHIKAVCEKLDGHMKQQIAEKSKNCCEVKNLFSMYTLDVIASAAYGLDGGALTSTTSDFTKLVQHLFLPNDWSLIETTALLFSPFLGNVIRYYYVPLSIQRWLSSVISKVLEKKCSSVEHSESKQSDFLQWLVDARQRSHEPIDAPTMVGHSATFLLEGFETSSSTMAFALYELARNPSVQMRVQQEIDEVLARYDGQVCYEAIQDMSYLGATLYEALRLHPAMGALLKECTKEFELPANRPGGKSFKVPVGMVCVIPVKAIHYDPVLFPNPLQFKPERFLGQNEKSHGGLFLGFGEGPRMCPGLRFGLAQSKAGLATVLSRYTVEFAPNANPFKISATTFLTAAQNGIWLSFKSRK